MTSDPNDVITAAEIAACATCQSNAVLLPEMTHADHVFIHAIWDHKRASDETSIAGAG